MGRGKDDNTLLLEEGLGLDLRASQSRAETQSDKLRKNINQHGLKNSLSTKMEDRIKEAIKTVQQEMEQLYPGVTFTHQKDLKKEDIVSMLRADFPEYADQFEDPVVSASCIRPDGGFLFAEIEGKRQLILVSEAKRQGTNDKRLAEGKVKQAKGNAIERLGKNLTEVRSLFAAQQITPFVCFGEGVDFDKDSSILDRVLSMNHNMKLNTTYIKSKPPFQPVSMYFRKEPWETSRMTEVMLDVAKQSMDHYVKTSQQAKEAP